MAATKFLLFTLAGTILSWLTWAVVLVRINPDSGGVLAHGLFFISLWLALIGSGTLIGFWARHLFERQGVPYRQMTTAARQALNVSLVAVVLLGLQATRLLTIWTGLLTVLIAIGIESFYLAGQSRHRTDLTAGATFTHD